MSQTNAQIENKPMTELLSEMDSIPNAGLATIMLATAYNSNAPHVFRALSAVASKRLAQLQIDVPAEGAVFPANALTSKTIAHCLGLYEPSETGCAHFDGEEAPTIEDVEQLQRLVKAGDIVVVVRNAKEFLANEEAIEQAAGSFTVTTDTPEDEIEEEPAPGEPIPADAFRRLFPNATAQTTSGRAFCRDPRGRDCSPGQRRGRDH